MKKRYQIRWAEQNQPFNWVVVSTNVERCGETVVKHAIDRREAVEFVAQKIDVVAQVDVRKICETKVLTIDEFVAELYEIRDDRGDELLSKKAEKLIGTPRNRFEHVFDSIIDHLFDVCWSPAKQLGLCVFARAEQAAEDALPITGFGRWRIPTRWELESLLDGDEQLRVSLNDVDVSNFDFFWSATRGGLVFGQSARYVVNGLTGDVVRHQENSPFAAVLLVSERNSLDPE